MTLPTHKHIFINTEIISIFINKDLVKTQLIASSVYSYKENLFYIFLLVRIKSCWKCIYVDIKSGLEIASNAMYEQKQKKVQNNSKKYLLLTLSV